MAWFSTCSATHSFSGATMPSKHLKLKCVKMDLSPDPNTHPVSPMLAIIHPISFKPTGNLVAPPSKCIQHLTTEIQNITVHHYSTLAAPLPSALAPEMCPPHSSQSEPVKKLGGIILKSFIPVKLKYSQWHTSLYMAAL